jgi:catechol 2,3-dioxygenase-like lactoylglutathione lyase family enzyme
VRKVDDLDSLILFVSDLGEAKAFYVDTLGLPLRFEDDIIAVVGGPLGQIVLHRNDRGHDDRGAFSAGSTAGAASLRFNVSDPDEGSWRRDEPECRFFGVLRMRPGGDS